MSAVWERLHTTPTLSSTAHTFPLRKGMPTDSLEWTLGAEYDHEKDLFKDKPTILRREGQDCRTCQAQVLAGRLEAAERELRAEAAAARTEAAEQLANAPSGGSPDTAAGGGVGEAPTAAPEQRTRPEGVTGPRVCRVRAGDSLIHHLQYTPRATHTLTVPKAAQGYARNPTGAFFTS
ncbi:uncharacterized protein LOC127000198 [Eriocheir sinensis]|uniref:uncharacterized protein LOC127000198 n=1 Tax=Eriocheir sinensis TaxID=95602 RepID=UPI0021C86731|nr:uncharacterized protein LOC127000198 [Eriocheir sinensis]